jgi:hypothetical protein
MYHTVVVINHVYMFDFHKFMEAIMKHALPIIFLFALLIFFPSFLTAVVCDYGCMIYPDQPYAEITGGTVIGNESTDDQRFTDPAVPLGTNGASSTGPGFPLGFSFNFNGATFDRVAINANGWISLGQSSLGTSAVNIGSTVTYQPLSSIMTITPSQLTNRISAFGADIIAQSGSSIRLLTSGTAPYRKFTIQWHNYRRIGSLGESLNFQIRLGETYNGVTILFGPCTIGINSYYINPQIGLRGPDFTDYANRTTMTNWSATTLGLTNAAICLCTPTVSPTNGLQITYNYPIDWGWDMAALSIYTQNTSPSVGSFTNIGVMIKNMGSMTQSNYTVKLMSGTTELASMPGPSITYQQVLSVNFDNFFTSPGPLSIYGKVVATADNVPENNSSPILDLNIQPVDTNWVTIGLGDLGESSPIEVSEHNSLYETIYNVTEINVTGQITAMTLYYRFNDSSTVTTPLKIWLGTTTMTDLSNNWMPSTMMTNVFDGTLTLPIDQNSVTINFTTPFHYSENNLVVLLNRPMTTNFFSTGDYWFVQYDDLIRGRGAYSMTSTLDPANPPTTGVNLSHMFPKVTFIMNTTPITISGTVVGCNNESLGLANSTVHITSPIEYTAQTNMQGQFVVNNAIPNRLYDLTVSHEGFETYSSPFYASFSSTFYVLIILNEIYSPPTNLVAETMENNAFIHWHETISTHTGYKVWRLRPGEESNEDNWTLLTPTNIIDTTFIDTQWSYLPNGLYIWAVKSVKPDNSLTNAAFTNALQDYSQTGTLTGTVMTTEMIPIHGARISSLIFETYTDESGNYSMTLPADTLDIVCSAAGYDIGVTNHFSIPLNQATNMNFALGPATVYNDSFENYEDFSIDFPTWINIDLDGSGTLDLGLGYPNATNPKAFMIYNPYATTPTSFDWLPPHSGNKLAVCWANYYFFSVPIVNNDWLITPLLGSIGQGASFHFWARSMDWQVFERFRVLISGGETNPEDFVLLSTDPYILTNMPWVQYEYTIPQTYYGKAVRIAINCVTFAGDALSVDDFEFSPGIAINNDDPQAPVVVTALYGNYPNPFQNETHIGYSISKAGMVKLAVYNIRGQKVRILESGKLSPGSHTVTWDGSDDAGKQCASGVYFCRMETGKCVQTRKLIMLK